MKVVDTEKSEHGPQRRKNSAGALLHCCCICGIINPWGKGWSHYSSLLQEDNSEPIAKFCSEWCQKRGGKNAELVTPEMMARAKQAEWREPEIAYREATEREKFREAYRAQKSRSPERSA